MAEPLNVLTLNCWGLKYLAKYRAERLAQIGAELAHADPQPDIVGLQECWTQKDYLAIRKQTQHFLPYGKFYFSGVFGGGLAILSRWPIDESSMVQYPLNGRPTAFFRGDWFVGKGVACATIKMQDRDGRRGRTIQVFCTHLHAPYEREPNDSYLCHRTAQAWEIAKLMRRARVAGNLVLALGDFNMVPLSLAHQLITTHSHAVDAWRELHPSSSLGAALDAVERVRDLPIPSAAYNITENGATCDSVLNTWRWNKSDQKKLFSGTDRQIHGETPDPRAKRLDYVFVGDARGEWQVAKAKVGMRMRHPELRVSLSDHFSVEVTIEPQEGTGPTVVDDEPEKFLPVETYDRILHVTEQYTARQRFQRRARLGHFGGQLVVWIGCLTAVWWSPRNFVSFILMLVSGLGLTAGVIDGLIGGLFVSAELRALKEFRWEIENARDMAKGK
ncbi:DNase I-like protein [Trichodelitschia bisporula]|uniref:DNase I-like protein n=1 Tax=Trichodelitschia bisporula TaxID=703511 RepID=A0A6G1I385_9PEZI|nr:DNase I-like protein [Trichodelitschia bisporula]